MAKIKSDHVITFRNHVPDHRVHVGVFVLI